MKQKINRYLMLFGLMALSFQGISMDVGKLESESKTTLSSKEVLSNFQHGKTFLSSGELAWAQKQGEKGKPTIIYIHGNSASKAAFLKQLNSETLKAYSAYAIDLLGHGDSGNAYNPEVTYTFPGYGEMLVEFLEKENIENAIVCGWSLGGHVAISAAGKLAAKGSNRIVGLLLSGTPPFALSEEGVRKGFNFFNAQEEEKTKKIIESGGNEELKPQDLIQKKEKLTKEEALTFVRMGGISPEEAPNLVEDAQRTDGLARFYTITNASNGKEEDYQNLILEKYDIPVAFICGEKDYGINSDYIEKGVQYKKKYKIWYIDTNHACQWNGAELFNEYLNEFIEAIIQKKI